MWAVLLAALTVVAVALRYRGSQRGAKQSSQSEQGTDGDRASPRVLASLKLRYLTVMLVIRFADWLQGPYFYDAYASKINSRTGQLFTPGAISFLFLVGFSSGAVFGTLAGSLTDSFGRCAAPPPPPLAAAIV